jgi:hypothetical protein
MWCVKRILAVGLVLAVCGADVGIAEAAPSEFGLAEASASLSSHQAGGHPDFTTKFATKLDSKGVPFAKLRSLTIELPPGLTGNPTAIPTCTAAELVNSASQTALQRDAPFCPIDSQVGITEVTVQEPASGGTFREPVYNMAAPGGNVVARLGFIAQYFPTFINIETKPERNYALVARIEGASGSSSIVAATTTLWGDPGDSSHDLDRITPYEAGECGGAPCTAPGEKPRESGLGDTPFMTAATACEGPQQIAFTAVSYAEASEASTVSAPLGSTSGCGLLDFKPKVTFQPTTEAADSSSGLDVNLTIPQIGLAHQNLLAEANLRRAIVQLPEGMTLNPSAAAGLLACSEDQMGLIGESPVRFNDSAVQCPEGSKVGTVTIKTPLLPEELTGSLYLASQAANPFHTLLAGYLVAEGQGVRLKLAGRFDVDQNTGRITAFFDENPQLPFEELELHFKRGDHGVLTTPGACGTYSITSALTPWSAPNPTDPASTELSESTSGFSIRSGPSGGVCPNGSLSANLSAGTVNPTAGAYSPFTMQLTRSDGTPRLTGVELRLPPGLTGRLAGIPYCPDNAIGAAASLNQPGQGAVELGSPSCPAASQIGTVTTGVGSGPSPFYVSTGRVYLAGPYKGAPLSLAIVVPAVAGPFDLGDVVVRSALFVDPETARITAVSDQLPVILDGIPLDLRDLRVSLDRPGFTLNPTSCKPMEISATTDAGAAVDHPASRFQVGDCAALGFKPQLQLQLKGATKRSGHPALRAVVTYPKKGAYANIARAQVGLPHSEFLDQGNLNKVCTQPELRSRSCPKKSIYGHAKAWTPLLDKPLEGPVYLAVGFGYKLPALVAELNGQVRILLKGKVDTTKQHGIRNTFEAVPDSPVSRFVLEMKGGKNYGLLENSENVCLHPQRASGLFTGQNGATLHVRPKIANGCKGKNGS